MNHLIPRGAKVMAAVSGGLDSMVLLNCLLAIKRALDISIVVGHIDHGLRPSSKADALFVAGQCKAMGLEATVREVDVRSVAKERGLTLEEAARFLRYAALGEMARETGASVVLTAHTASDQAETVLMRLLRGTGPLGLCGIAPRREDGFARPLLCASREEVRKYARRKRIEWREDPTNKDIRFLRNRIRLQVLPLLRRLNPRIDFVLCELADDSRHLADFVYSILPQPSLAPGMVMLSIEQWQGLAKALRPYAVLEMFHAVTNAPLGLSRTHVHGVLRLTESASPKVLYLPRQVVAKWAPDSGLSLETGQGRRR